MKTKHIILAAIYCVSAMDLAHAQVTPLSKAVVSAENMQPAIPRPEQDKAAIEKLAALEKRTGRKPNILWFVIDDMGYGDPGCFGGGAAIGAATPNMDRLAREGLKLTSCYSQPHARRRARQFLPAACRYARA